MNDELDDTWDMAVEMTRDMLEAGIELEQLLREGRGVVLSLSAPDVFRVSVLDSNKNIVDTEVGGNLFAMIANLMDRFRDKRIELN